MGLLTTDVPTGYLLKLGTTFGTPITDLKQLLQDEQSLANFIQAFDHSVSVFGFDSCINEI